MTDRDNVVPLTRGAVQPTEEMNERLAALRQAKVVAAIAAIDAHLDYWEKVEKNRRPVEMWMMDETDEARCATKDAYYAGLQNGEVIERWFDRPSIVAPLLLVMASFMLACVVIVLIAGGS